MTNGLLLHIRHAIETTGTGPTAEEMRRVTGRPERQLTMRLAFLLDTGVLLATRDEHGLQRFALSDAGAKTLEA